MSRFLVSLVQPQMGNIVWETVRVGASLYAYSAAEGAVVRPALSACSGSFSGLELRTAAFQRLGVGEV